ncbi:DUF5333 domain-containing protein [Amylibacter sp.]|nr:DUF5333 domain-containing protein [Amylibacter sp.]MDA9370235.1 DUF5333 domain-containing protein [Amylibacter sp.]
MRLATFTLFGFIMIYPVSAFSQSALWDVATINRGLFNIGIAHGIRKNCSFIKANTLVGISYVWSLMGHATDAGFTIKETREFIDNDAEKEILRSRVNKYFLSLGINPRKSNTLCELGKEEIVNKSQIGKLLRMN